MKTDYFALIISQAQCSLDAAKLLKRILQEYRPDSIATQLNEMHAIEHQADNIRHDVMKHLAKDFITPIEQEDLTELTRLMDDVTDAIDEVVINLYMYAIKDLPKDTVRLVDVVFQCVNSLFLAATEFKNHKKPEPLMKLLIEVNSEESKADTAYIEAMRTLFLSERDPLRVMGIKAVYDALESCCDLCEHAADVMEGVVMNNL